nr:hypothetical protein [Tanacetum cinerariifolium]
MKPSPRTKGKGILVEDPKPMKKKQQVEMDEAYARKLHEELNQDIDWDVAIEHVKQKAKEDPFKLDYFKGKPYDDIRPIFEVKFNTNMEFLLKSKEKIEEEESRALESINETPAQKVAKRRRLNQEDKDVEEIKQYMEIVPDEDDDVYTEATPLARKAMFGRPDGQDNVWKSQRSVHGQKIPTLEVCIGTNAKCSKTSNGRADFGVDVANEFEEKHQVDAVGLLLLKDRLMLLSEVNDVSVIKMLLS